jgi:hypothetical protein
VTELVFLQKARIAGIAMINSSIVNGNPTDAAFIAMLNTRFGPNQAELAVTVAERGARKRQWAITNDISAAWTWRLSNTTSVAYNRRNPRGAYFTSTVLFVASMAAVYYVAAIKKEARARFVVV